MQIAMLSVGRLIIHEVVQASRVDSNPPLLHDTLVDLEEMGRSLIGARVAAAMTSGSHSIDVSVEDSNDGSPFQQLTTMLDSDDEEFIYRSQLLATELTRAQTSGSIKRGTAVFMQGECLANGDRPRRYIAVVKADSDKGLQKSDRSRGKVTLSYVSDLIFGESQRLLKVGLLIECNPPKETQRTRKPKDFFLRVFDHTLQSGAGGTGAVYFYSTFLRCRLSRSAPVLTKDFYEKTREFISRLNTGDEEKKDLVSDLISYLRSNREVIESVTFAQEYLPRTAQSEYIRYCETNELGQGISKDMTLLKGKIRRQSVKFSSSVTISAPPEIMKDSVLIGDTEEGWTSIRIKGSVEKNNE